MEIGFDSGKYLEEQSKYILERVSRYKKLYLEFGGKLVFDYHAKRVLPGFDENAKIKLLKKLSPNVEVIICLYSGDIEKNKIRGDFGITYDMDVMKLIDDLRSYHLDINSVVITRYDDRNATNTFINQLERRGIKVYKHRAIPGYPTDINVIVSDEGYGKNNYIETTKQIVVVNGPGAGSGKLATCLSQLYHEHKRGNIAGYSKFETFPVWNVPLKHPLHIAYEAATVDLKDINMIDPFHMEAYHEVAVNYNRDIEAFPLLKRIIEKITGENSEYKSPTDMGVNRVGFGIVDDAVVSEASKQEVIRRYFITSTDYKKGYADMEMFDRARNLMEELGLTETDRYVVGAARNRRDELKNLRDANGSGDDNIPKDHISVVALRLSNGHVVTGKSTALMDAAAAVILNAIKHLASIDKEIHLISPVILSPILELKNIMTPHNSRVLSCEEVLIALSISAVTNPTAQVAVNKLKLLSGCHVHSTTILNKRDEQTFANLGINATSDPQFPTENLYYS